MPAPVDLRESLTLALDSIDAALLQVAGARARGTTDEQLGAALAGIQQSATTAAELIYVAALQLPQIDTSQWSAEAVGDKLSTSIGRRPVPGSVRSAYRKPMRQARLIRRNLSYNNCIAK